MQEKQTFNGHSKMHTSKENEGEMPQKKEFMIKNYIHIDKPSQNIETPSL